MSEHEYMAEQAKKERARFKRALKRVDKTGEEGRWWNEALATAELIQFGGPRDGVSRWNCWRLTEKGREELGKV